MKTPFIAHLCRRLATILAGTALLASSVSCMTTYDRSGRPVQSVDPGLAVAGVAAAGLIGYALADDGHHGHRGYHRSPPPRRYHCR